MNELANLIQPPSKSFCLECRKEMRKWISEENVFSMCVNKDCVEHGEIKRDIWNIKNIKIRLTI